MDKSLTLFYAIVFLVLGAAGVLVGGYGQTLFGLGLSGAHNAVHILSGLLAFAAFGIGEKACRVFLWFVLIGYGLLVLAAFFGFDPLIEILNLNLADYVLHIILAAIAGWRLAGHRRNHSHA